jgi:hypothetical protein
LWWLKYNRVIHQKNEMKTFKTSTIQHLTLIQVREEKSYSHVAQMWIKQHNKNELKLKQVHCRRCEVFFFLLFFSFVFTSNIYCFGLQKSSSFLFSFSLLFMIIIRSWLFVVKSMSVDFFYLSVVGLGQLDIELKMRKNGSPVGNESYFYDQIDR